MKVWNNIISSYKTWEYKVYLYWYWQNIKVKSGIGYYVIQLL